jgi:hypothetical protein
MSLLSFVIVRHHQHTNSPSTPLTTHLDSVPCGVAQLSSPSAQHGIQARTPTEIDDTFASTKEGDMGADQNQDHY